MSESAERGPSIAKEFVIDIDINDYPGRSCCNKEPKICSKCWAYLVVAVKVIDGTLRDLGYKRLLWVFSGRRGMHLWVCDRKAMLMKDEDRRKFMDKLVGFRTLNGEEVSTWRPESYAGVDGNRHGSNKISKEKKFADRMRRPIDATFQ